MPKNFENKNLQNANFKGEDLSYASFLNSDLRGADFTGANLTGANLSQVKTGITPRNTFLLFLVALVISLLAGYVAMLGGRTVQTMLHSPDKNIRAAGIGAIVFVVIFISFSWWNGVKNAITYLILPACALAVLIGIASYVSGFGTGEGMLYLMLAFVLLGIMFIIGTIARAAARSLSNIIFLVVALSGGTFGKSIGGGIGAVIIALACAQISKRALSKAKGFEGLKRVAGFITIRFGTSFRNSRLSNADFLNPEIHNADFTNADLSAVNWGNSKKKNCVNTTFIVESN